MPRSRPEPVLERADVQRRLKAARAFAGYRTPQALAEHPEMQRHGIPATRVVQTEAMRRDAEPWELSVIARACGLPEAFMTAPVERIVRADEEAVGERLAAIEAKLDRLLQEGAGGG